VELPLPTAPSGLPDFDASTWPRKILTLLLIQYASTAIAMPFEGAKVLSQVEWIPKEGVSEWIDEEIEEDERDDESDASVRVC
jgi:mitochondrial fusion and transport protein UGO1